MLDRGMVPQMAEAVQAAKDLLRLDGTGEDALIAGLVTAAIERCEAETGDILIVRPMREVLPTEAAWRFLGARPVRSVSSASGMAQDGSETILAPTDYEIDIDSEARGRIRMRALSQVSRLAVRYSAGLSSGWSGLPTGLRHGMIRLVAHWYAYRDTRDTIAMPSAVTALWAPHRRLRLI